MLLSQRPNCTSASCPPQCYLRKWGMGGGGLGVDGWVRDAVNFADPFSFVHI